MSDVYVLLDTRNPGFYKYGRYEFNYLPFYVGKAKDTQERISRHLAGEGYGSLKHSIISEIAAEGMWLKFQRVYKNITDAEALRMEMKVIKAIGRLEDGTGPLTNQTKGGEGVAGRRMSEEEREYRGTAISRAIQKRKKEDPEYHRMIYEVIKHNWASKSKEEILYITTKWKASISKKSEQSVKSWKEKLSVSRKEYLKNLPSEEKTRIGKLSYETKVANGTIKDTIAKTLKTKLQKRISRHQEILKPFAKTLKCISGIDTGTPTYWCKYHGEVKLRRGQVEVSIQKGFTGCKFCNLDKKYGRR